MSLGSWFRAYVYIPLGGNRVCFARHLCNILIVWILTGLWHGAAWNFIMWGIYFAFLLILEKLWLLKFLKRHKLCRHIYVLLAVLISFVLFDASDLQQAFFYIRTMFTANGYPLVCTQKENPRRNSPGYRLRKFPRPNHRVQVQYDHPGFAGRSSAIRIQGRLCRNSPFLWQYRTKKRQNRQNVI